ncbi:MAG: DinB family protein [Aphanocapsa lilacina HA4352-LM1]|jgi:uncharacterized damage-inducible protein DinB|nr:DinB family protein [Aphanocapsa lilacina HA4352-LM1]
METLAHHFATMAYNNAWSNHRLLKACAQLSQTDFATARTGFFPSIKATLNHSVTVDWYYLDATERSVQGEPPNPEALHFFDPEEPFEACGPLWQAQLGADRRLIALCESLTEPLLALPVHLARSFGIQTEPLVRVLAHLFQHQIHHRGQAHAMLAGTSVKSPQLDEFFCAGEAHLRAADFEELGFSEQKIWGDDTTPLPSR